MTDSISSEEAKSLKLIGAAYALSKDILSARHGQNGLVLTVGTKAAKQWLDRELQNLSETSPLRSVTVSTRVGEEIIPH